MTHTVMKRYRLHHLYRGQGGGAAEVLASDSLVPAADHRTARCARRPVITSQGATESRRGRLVSRIRHLYRPSRAPLVASSRVTVVSLNVQGLNWQRQDQLYKLRALVTLIRR